MTEKLVDFNMRVMKPRKEFVGLMRVPISTDLYGFLSSLREACALAYVKHRIRYRRVPKHVDIWVQRGQRVLSRLRVSSAGFDVKIEAWSANRLSDLFQVFLEYRFLQHGKVLGYYERVSRGRGMEQQLSMDRVLYRTQTQDMVTPEAAMRSARFELLIESESAISIIDRMKAAGFKSPIAISS